MISCHSRLDRESIFSFCHSESVSFCTHTEESPCLHFFVIPSLPSHSQLDWESIILFPVIPEIFYRESRSIFVFTRYYKVMRSFGRKICSLRKTARVVIPILLSCHSCIFFCHSCESRNPFFYWYSWIPHQVRNHKESGNCHSQLDWESTLLPPCHSRNLLSGIHSSPLCHSRNFYRESIPFKEV